MTVPLLSPPLRPTGTLVAIAWIGSVPGLYPAMVGRQLPPDVDPDGSAAAWTMPGGGIGFIQVSPVGGNPDPMIPVRNSVMQLDCWDTVPGSNEPPWESANGLAETVIFASYQFATAGRPLVIEDSGITYPQAQVMAVNILTEPRQVFDDAGDYARYSLDAQFTWKQLERF